MICPDCEERKATIRCNSTGNVYRCSECEKKKEKELGIERDDSWIGSGIPPYAPRDFMPYMLEHGPIDSISDLDPNKCKFNSERGNGIGDSLFISSKRAERGYFKDMDIRAVDKGEKLTGGVKAELKDKPAPRKYSFKNNLISSK